VLAGTQIPKGQMANKSRARRAKKQQAKYSPERLTKDLDSVRKVYANLGRGRFAIYGYWKKVYGLRRKWRRLHKNKGLDIQSIANRAVPGVPASSALRFILHQTMGTTGQGPKASTRLSKLKWKYFAVLNNAYKQDVETRDLVQFIKEHGGLNFKKKTK
jgi:hypothetical protein